MASLGEQLELAFAGPGELARRVRERELRPAELVELFLARIAALDPQLNAFRATLAEEATAAASADRLQRGPLAGVPVAIKDDTEVRGQAMTRGTRAPVAREPADAEIVRRLRAAGAIPIGITRVPELMIWPWTASDAGGITRNPWDPERTPGGSSGGSAAAVAAGMVPAASGSDGGGSIRIPAACCGLVGMKPSRGRISAAPAREHWLGLSVRGMLARTVADSALLFDVIAGPAPGEAEPGLPAPAGGFAQAARTPPPRLRVAASRKVPPGILARLSADQALAFDRTARLLAELGHEVIERDPHYGAAALVFTECYLGGIAADFESVPAGTPTERSTRQLAAAGRLLVPPRRRECAKAHRDRAARGILALWREVDVLLTPALASAPLPAAGGHGRSGPAAFALSSRFTPWTPAFNLTGQPAISLPAGFDADGLPTAIQLVAAPGAEALLYSLAGELERADPWAGSIPALARL
jgi:amidase